MDILVFGATGRVGRAFVARALESGHAVTAVVRDAAAAMPPNVTVTTGDVTDARVARVVKRDHVIVGTLGGIDALAVGYPNIIRAASPGQRMLALVGAGVLQADGARLRNELPDYPERFRAVGRAHQAVFDGLAASSLDWTLVCAPNIVDGASSGAARAEASFLPDGRGSITTGDVAAFMLDEITHARFSRQRVGLNGI